MGVALLAYQNSPVAPPLISHVGGVAGGGGFSDAAKRVPTFPSGFLVKSSTSNRRGPDFGRAAPSVENRCQIRRRVMLSAASIPAFLSATEQEIRGFFA